MQYTTQKLRSFLFALFFAALLLLCWIIIFAAFLSLFWSVQKDIPLATIDLYHSYGVQTILRKFGPESSHSGSIFNVDAFGAKADGITDDTEAFIKAWNRACSSEGSVLLIPKSGKYYLIKQIRFSGPCRSPLTVKILGIIKAPSRQSEYQKGQLNWIEFNKVQNLRVNGGGTFNGNGWIWWKMSCKVNRSRPCTPAPTAVTFRKCNNLTVANLRFMNAQQIHLTFKKCVNAKAVNLRVIAPSNSPNTDGIHVTYSQNIRIMNSLIKTGDDCISIVSQSKNITATGITCGPGHGISIGSLGANNSAAYVSDVMVNKARLLGTTNGLRIKTWQGGSGYAKNIRFQNIEMHNVRYPIIIDQNYCDRKESCLEQAPGVQVSNVVYSNIKGTSATDVGLKLECSKQFPCRGIVLENVNLYLLRHQLDNASLLPKVSCKNVEPIMFNGTTSRRLNTSLLCS